MKARKQNVVNRDRHRLEEVLPLRTPYTLCIDPCNLCNFRCGFCAIQSAEAELPFQKQRMPMELYRKIVDDIAAFPEPLKALRLNGNGEPLLHPEFPEMVRYAKERGIADSIEFLTNGSKLNPELNEQLVASGLDRIRISIEEISEEGYRHMAGVSIDFDRLVSNIRDLYERSVRAGNPCEVYVKTVDAAVSTKEKEETFYRLFGDICHRIWIDHVIPLWSGWGEIGNRFELQKTGMHGQAARETRVCPFPFYSLIINPDGEVTLCCSDWQRKLVVGDLTRQSLLEVWNGEPLRKFWIDMLSGRKDQYEMCARCGYLRYNAADNIDDYAAEILKRM